MPPQAPKVGEHSDYFEQRAKALRKYYGKVEERDWKKFAHLVWYSAQSNKVLPEEPAEEDDDGYFTCLTESTQYVSMYGKPYLRKE